jgi:LysR family hca operon transcriptional activator
MHDLSHRHLRYFIAVAQDLSFTRAAERLHIVQPSLSQQIQRLEEIVGTPLFYRSKHHVELTEAGRVFLHEAQEILQFTDRAITQARKASRAEIGQLFIGFVPGTESDIFPFILPELKARCPEIDLSLLGMSSPEQIVALLSGEIHVGFLRGPIVDDQLAHEVILRQKIVAAVPANHPVAKASCISPAALASLPVVRVSAKNAPAVDRIMRDLEAQAGIHYHTATNSENILTTMNAVGSGLGFSFVPDYARHIATPAVAFVSLDLEVPPEIELLVAYRKDGKLPVVAYFLNLLRDCLQSPARTSA